MTVFHKFFIMKYILKCCFACFVLLASCSKESIQNSKTNQNIAQIRSSLPQVIGLLNIVDKPVDGFISINSSDTGSSQFDIDKDYGVQIGAQIFSESLLLNPEKIEVNNLEIPFDNSLKEYPIKSSMLGMSNLYGTNVSVRGGSNLSNLDVSFYSPKHLKLNVNPSSDEFIETNRVISWNLDERNNFGIGIVLEFDPKDADNIRAGFINRPYDYQFIHTNDTGSYTFGESDLANFPKGAHINFYIGRGNYERKPLSDSKNIGIFSYSTISHTFIVR